MEVQHCSPKQPYHRVSEVRLLLLSTTFTSQVILQFPRKFWDSTTIINRIWGTDEPQGAWSEMYNLHKIMGGWR
jgi:hypothetical protein